MFIEYVLLAFCAFGASLITFYSGFGLGTILMPIVAIFFPLPVSIGLTAIVHLFHNLLKSGLLKKAIDWKTVFYFGAPAMVLAIPGAWLLQKLASLSPIKTYTLFNTAKEISTLNLLIGLLLIFFASAELYPKKINLGKKIWIGGAISGFFGGLSGNQGAFRSLFLLHSSLPKESFIATNAAIAVFVDLIRLFIYSLTFSTPLFQTDKLLIIGTLAGAFLGICLGLYLLPKTTISLIQKFVISLLYILGALLATGLLSG